MISNISPLTSISVILQYTLYEALKNRIVVIGAVFAVLGIAAASFFGDFAVIETNRTEIAVLSSFYRFCAVFTVMILVVSTMVREFNDKCLELYLSLPISRLIYFLGKLSGFFIAGIAVAAIYAATILLYADFSHVVFWFFSLVCELIIITAISFFCVMTFNQQVPAAVITAFFFYLLCRLSDVVVLVSQSEIILHTFGFTYLQAIIQAIVVILPSLGRFTQSEWLIYGEFEAGILGVIIGQTIIYTVLLSGASLFDFIRKNL